MRFDNYDTRVVDNIITGYLPHSIYAFETHTYPNYLKVGDTNRLVNERLREWQRIYKDLIKKYETEAMIEDENGEKTIFFRDYSIHNYLIENKSYEKLSDKKYESEFFKGAQIEDIEEAVSDIKQEYIKEGSRKYNYYQIGETNSVIKDHWARVQEYEPRPNQKEVITNIVEAVERERDNLLLYAVMRFGKSNVAIWAAKEINSNLTVIVTGKADVKTEWQKTVESHKDFENFIFIDIQEFTKDFIKKHSSKNIVVFTTLQDLSGSRDVIKEKHSTLFSSEIDFLIIDETHFGARAKIFSQALENKEEDVDYNEIKEESFNIAFDNINSLKSKIKLHLSGTPYRILLSGEFEEQDIVGKVQFTDILSAKKSWSEENIEEDEERPWNNPYFGFPEMIRFAFAPNKSSVKLIESLKNQGLSAELNNLFSPESTAKTRSKTVRFKYESEVLNLLKSMDGSEEDNNVFPFLNYQRIQEGNLAKHMVFVLPYKNSVDAMERLLIEKRDSFKNLNSYEILNVAGNTSKFENVNDITNVIKTFAKNDTKTITLTVNKMLTGTTVPEWDTMVFLKDTKSPQEYDQAIFRLQSPWIKDIKNTVTGEKIGREDMKPQTLLIDFSPNRIFKIESERALVINASEGKSGNDKQIIQLNRNLQVSPIIYLNKNKLKEVKPTDVIDKIREYSAEKSILDEVHEIPVDESLYKYEDVLSEISSQSEIGSNSGFETNANEDDDTDIEGLPNDNNKVNGGSEETEAPDKTEESSLPTIKQMLMYYSRILFYAFLSPENERTLSDIIESVDSNKRLAQNLSLKKSILKTIKKNINPFVLAPLDNKIENIGELRNDASEEDILKAIVKFNRISENEVFTPIWVAKMMVDKLVTDNFINDYKVNPKAIIDFSSKSGVYLILIYQKLLNGGVDKSILKNKLYAVATSDISYEFTRAVFEEFDWNLKNLADSSVINSYQLAKKEISIDELLEVYGDDELKFDIVIGNPPYQEKAKGTSSSDDPIYHLFLQEAYDLAPKVMFITPARFLFNAGKTPVSWNKQMLNDNHLSVEYYEHDSNNVFPNTSIPGGVVVTYRDIEIDYGKIGTFVSFPELKKIMQKVWIKEQESIKEIIYSQNKFNLDNLYEDHPEYKDIIGSNGKDKRFRQIIMERLPVFTESIKNDDDIKVLGKINRNREYRYILRKYVEETEWLDRYKVFVPFSNGASGTLGTEPARMISTPVLGKPGEGITQTFISFGNYSTQTEGENLLLYIKSKFARALLGILKVTQGNKADTWEYVPLQDFSSNSDIDWSKSPDEIDKQLYQKYRLDEDEISFIEEKLARLD